MVTQQEYDDLIKRNKEYQQAKNKAKCPKCGSDCIKNLMISVSTGSYCNNVCAYNSLVLAKKNLEQEILRFLLRREPK